MVSELFKGKLNTVPFSVLASMSINILSVGPLNEKLPEANAFPKNTALSLEVVFSAIKLLATSFTSIVGLLMLFKSTKPLAMAKLFSKSFNSKSFNAMVVFFTSTRSFNT